MAQPNRYSPELIGFFVLYMFLHPAQAFKRFFGGPSCATSNYSVAMDQSWMRAWSENLRRRMQGNRAQMGVAISEQTSACLTAAWRRGLTKGTPLLAQWSIRLSQQHEGRLPPGRERACRQQGFAWRRFRRFPFISSSAACTVTELPYVQCLSECAPG